MRPAVHVTVVVTATERPLVVHESTSTNLYALQTISALAVFCAQYPIPYDSRTAAVPLTLL